MGKTPTREYPDLNKQLDRINQDPIKKDKVFTKLDYLILIVYIIIVIFLLFYYILN